MELIYTDNNFVEKGFLKNVSIDIEIGKYGISKNDFELTVPTVERDPLLDEGSLFFSEGTEWGGLVDSKKVDTLANTLTLRGLTFRGLIQKEYVQPPTGSAYMILKGEANTIIKQLVGNRFGDLVTVDNVNKSGITVNYQVRDMNLLEAIEKTLGNVNARLEIKFFDGQMHLQALTVQDLSERIQYDNSYQVNMTIETVGKPYNHILALGSGELTGRLRTNLYLQENGTWGETEFYTGFQRKTYKHEDSNIGDIEELKSSAIEKVKETNGTDTLDITFSSDEAELFDVVGAKEQITGISFKQPITQKILKGSIYGEYENLSISYTVGD